MKDGSRRLVVGADEAVNYIFGRGRIGATNGLGRDLRKLREVLGPDSKEWKMVREEAFLRLFKGMPESGPFPAEKFGRNRSEEHTSELQSLMRLSYAVFCLKKKKPTEKNTPMTIPD